MKKFNLIYFLLCDHAIQDINKKISLIGIFQNFNVIAFPTAIASFVVAGSVTINDDQINTAKVELEIFDANNKLMAPTIPPLNIANIPPKIGESIRIFNFLFTMNGLSFKEKGNYKFRATIDGEIVGEIFLEAKTIH